MNWTTVENAITAWIKAGSGLGTGQVIWAQQEGPRPSGAFIDIRAMAIRQVGQDWLDVEDNPSPSAGAEIEQHVRGVRELTLQLQAFNGAAKGASSPTALLHACISASRFPSVHDALNTAGVGIGMVGPVQSIDGVIGATEFEPRAVLEIKLFTAEDISETGTHIEFVEVEDISDGDPGTSVYIPSNPS